MLTDVARYLAAASIFGVKLWLSNLSLRPAAAVSLLQTNPLVFFDISLDNNTPLGRITMELKVGQHSHRPVVQQCKLQSAIYVLAMTA
jgi:hypothetical protein